MEKKLAALCTLNATDRHLCLFIIFVGYGKKFVKHKHLKFGWLLFSFLKNKLPR